MIGQKPPLKPREVWAIRIPLRIAGRARDLALINLAVDGKLRGCDPVSLRRDDVLLGVRVRPRATLLPRKVASTPGWWRVVRSSRCSPGQGAQPEPQLSVQPAQRRLRVLFEALGALYPGPEVLRERPGRPRRAPGVVLRRTRPARRRDSG